MDCEFIESVETWGSGGQMMDVIVLKDGRVLVVAAHGITLYRDRAAFDSGVEGTRVESGGPLRLLRRSCG